jgi:hypothetical protein
MKFLLLFGNVKELKKLINSKTHHKAHAYFGLIAYVEIMNQLDPV